MFSILTRVSEDSFNDWCQSRELYFTEKTIRRAVEIPRLEEEIPIKEYS